MPRLEHKFLVPVSLLAPLRRAIAPFVRADEHASRQDGGAWTGYTVRSIYFDTSRFTYYAQALAGVERRAKVRIRAYDDHRDDADVMLEVKRRDGARSSKQRAAVTSGVLQSLLASSDVNRLVRATRDAPDSVENARRFLFLLRRDALHPVLLVAYDREAWVGLSDPSIRVTFDRRVRSTPFPALDDLYEERDTRPSFGGHIILEVKHDRPYGFPAWLRPFIERHRLARGGYSKYRAGVTDHALARASSRARVLGSAARAAGRVDIPRGACVGACA